MNQQTAIVRIEKTEFITLGGKGETPASRTIAVPKNWVRSYIHTFAK